MFGKFRNLLRELGPFGTLGYLVYRLCAWTGGWAALHSYLFVAQPVPASTLLSGKRGQSIRVMRLDPVDPILLSLPLGEPVLRYRATQNAICFAAFKGQEIIGCLWICLTPYEEDEVRCRYHPEPAGCASWDFDVFLVPHHRNGLGFARLWDTANNFLREQGVSVSWSRISAFNPTSIASHSRLGARIMSRATFLRLGRCQLMIASATPYFHLSWRQSDIPDIHLVMVRTSALGAACGGDDHPAPSRRAT